MTAAPGMSRQVESDAELVVAVGVVPFAGCNVAMGSSWLVLAGVIMRQRARMTPNNRGS
jgi:hypothetical protein